MKTLKLRLKNRHNPVLTQWSRDVNLVWNYVNNLSKTHTKRTRKFLSAFDCHQYLSGAAKELSIGSQTIQSITEELVTRRKQFKKIKLNWRVSNQKSPKRSLGWVPFKKAGIKIEKGQVTFQKRTFQLWDSFDLSKYPQPKCGSFSQDARGRWYISLVVDIKEPKVLGRGSVGIDLGLKDVAVCSDGFKVENPRLVAKYADKLAMAQRAHKKHLVRNIHAKVKNRRQDALQKASTKIVKNNLLVVVGNLKASTLVKTKMAKSTLDAGFSAFKTMLRYKCEYAGALFIEVNEYLTTQTCSSCGTLPDSRPKGIASLGIREWKCSNCGTLHDRDINAAINILALGHGRLAEGILSL